MEKIIVLGSINMDLVFKVDQIPRKGETIQGEGFFMSPGGKGANQAVACAKQHIFTYMVGSIGSDELSKACKASLLHHGVDCKYVRELNDHTCGVAGIFLEKDDNRIITDSGANKVHDIASIIKIFDTIGNKNDILISQLEIPLDVIEASFKKAKELHMITILNAAPARVLPASLFPLIDILVVNQTEIKMLTGIEPKNPTQIQKASKQLLGKKVHSVLLTLGQGGSVYVSSKDTILVDAYTVDVIDTTAAGDAYIGAFSAQLIKGNNIENSMRYATAAAALSIQKQGAQISIPSKEETIKFMIEQGVL